MLAAGVDSLLDAVKSIGAAGVVDSPDAGGGGGVAAVVALLSLNASVLSTRCQITTQ